MQILRMIFVLTTGVMVFAATPAHSKPPKQYEVFDGQIYNGKYYPRIDIIEGTYDEKPNTQEYQVYWKGHVVDMAFKYDDSTGKKRMLIRYTIKDRNEDLCRFVPVPGHFREGFHVYYDASDKDMNNTIISMQPPYSEKWKEIHPKKYEPCPEEEDDEDAPPAKAEGAKSSDASGRGAEPSVAPPKVDGGKFKSGTGEIKNKDASVPFSDW